MESPQLYYGVLTAQSDLLLTFCQNLLQERLFEKTPSQISLFPIYKSLEEKTKQKQELPGTASLQVQEASMRGKLILSLNPYLEIPTHFSFNAKHTEGTQRILAEGFRC